MKIVLATDEWQQQLAFAGSIWIDCTGVGAASSGKLPLVLPNSQIVATLHQHILEWWKPSC